MKKRHSMPVAAAALLSLVAAACSSDDGGTTTATGCSSEDLGGTAFAPALDTSGVTAAAAPVTPVLGQGDKPVVKVGWFGDLTGETSAYTVGSRNAAELAISQANEAGNLQVEIEFVPEDNKDALEATAPAVEQGFIQDDAVVGVIGGAFSGETLAVGDLFADAGLVHISPSATNPDITTKGWPFFRLLANDAVQGPKAAELIANMGCESVAVVNDKTDYGQGLAEQVAEGLGDAVVLEEGVEPTTDYTSLIDSIEAADPQLVFYGGYGPEASLIVKQMREKGLEAVFMSGDGSKDAAFVDGAGAENAEGSILVCPCADPTVASDEASVSFVEAYNEMFGEDPTIYAAEGYDAGNLMVAAIDASDDDGEVTRDEILAYFEGLDSYDGLTKTFSWDDNGELEGGAIIVYVVRDGVITQIGTVDEVS